MLWFAGGAVKLDIGFGLCHHQRRGHKLPDGCHMTKHEFVRRLEALKKEYQSSALNPGSFECTSCNQCSGCMFCRGCRACYKCTHCNECQDCSHCSHSRGCRQCHNCAYCIDCGNCSQSAYLVTCTNCTDCSYCFGCVGLAKADYHILNEAYSRDEYFERVRELKRLLGIR